MLTNRHAFPMVNRLGQEMDSLLSSFFDGGSFSPLRTRSFPAINVWEDAESLHAEAEVPGLTMNDLEIFVVGDELTIKGRRGAEKTEQVSYHRQERGVGEFARVLTLPYPVNAEKVEATLKDGVLMIVLPKAEEAKPRKIQIKS